jgi:hypothetical protein
MFDAKGPMGFAADHGSLLFVLAVLNSRVSDRYLGMLAPSLDFKIGHILGLPIPDGGDAVRSTLAHLAQQAIAVAKTEWDSDELSFDFVGLSLPCGGRIADWVAAAAVARRERATALWRIESLIDAEIASAEGLVVPVVEDEEFDDQGRDREESARALASYAVGCMFGRYSRDEPGLILADQGSTLQDYLAKIPTPSFTPDADNVIPIVDGDWFEDDIVERFRQFLRAVFGEQHFEENLRFVTESLGVKNLRDYFVKSFYKDHVQRYKKRPIYWLFSSPKGSFNALIYMHRYTPSTVSTVLNEYLREFQAKLKASLEQAERSNKAKEADILRTKLVELAEYEHDVLYPLASKQIAIDLDDGVKVNYPKLGAALKKIPGLEAIE